MRKTPWILLAVLLAQPAPARSDPAAPEPWRHVHGWLGGQRDRMTQDLESAHEVLLSRAQAAGATELVERLSPEPPRPRPRGYGVLPEILDDDPASAVSPEENRYSIESLSTSFTGAFRDARVLAARAAAEPELPLGPWVDEFERLRKRLRNLEDHLDYHANWQVAVVDYRDYFARNNRVVDKVRLMEKLREDGGPPEEIARLRKEILDQIAPFEPVKGLEIRQRRDGERELVVPVQTDIRDAAFLESFRQAVEGAFSDAAAARERRFVVKLRWKRIAPEKLYPEGAPSPGEPIDIDDHRKRFPYTALALTTGAESTHAWQGRSVLLGPGSITRRNLAHEFGHLLGFNDAYLRGFEGDPQGAYGVVLVEWVGLLDDLMGNPAGGVVTGEMVDRLIEAYSPD